LFFFDKSRIGAAGFRDTRIGMRGAIAMMNQNRLTRTLTATARRLYEKGDEVLVIDIDSNRINRVPTATYVLKDSDILIVLGSQGIAEMRRGKV
jgi:hypothetical protein